MTSRLRIVLLVAVAAVFAGWLSYRRAYAAVVATGAPETSSGIRERRPRQMAERGNKMEDLRQLLKRPVNSKSSDEAWAIISGFSVGQIKDALAGLPANRPLDAAGVQEAMLYFRWAQINPMEALEAVGHEAEKNEEKKYLLSIACGAWMKKDPDAVYQWAMSSAQIDRRFVFGQMAKLLSSLPMSEALEKAKAYDPVVRRNILTRLGGTMAGTPAEREAFLTGLARSGSDPADSAAGLNSFTLAWAAVDPSAALAGLKDLPMDDGTREKTRSQVTKYWTEKNPAAVISWMNSSENPQPLGDQVEVYRNWVEKSPEEAAKQFENLSSQSPGFRDDVMKSLLTSYYQGGWHPFGRSDRTDGVMFSRLKTHYDQWATSEPGSASAWLGSLDPALQQRLQSPDSHETH